MHRNGIDFEVISNDYISKFATIKSKKSIKEFTTNDIVGFNIVVDATGSTSVQNSILEKKKSMGFLYNCVDNPKVCDFFFSALVEFDEVKIAVSTSGASPTLAKFIRDKIKEFIPKEIGTFGKELKIKRDRGLLDVKSTKIGADIIINNYNK